jgi:uncharacterized phage protein (TIGR01671 family)
MKTKPPSVSPRVIKFRAWNTGERLKKGMYSWEDMKESLESEFNPRKSLFAPLLQSEQFAENLWIVLMQYTGLKDKNGKEIYEGDIVNGTHRFGLVIFKDAGFFVYDEHLDESVEEDEIEVIGNIYENPELLKCPPILP